MQKRLVWIIGVGTAVIAVGVYAVLVHRARFSWLTKTAPATTLMETFSSQITGQFAINPQFDGAAPFINGLAAVRVGDEKTGKWGYIDERGKYLLNPEFGGAKEFFDGLAAVRVGDNVTGKWGYIDRTGRILVNPQFDAVSSFDHKMAVVRLGDEKTGKWGYIDHTGKYFVNPQFDDAHAFTDDGLARVRIAGKWGYLRH
jgi:hypothetical protein